MCGIVGYIGARSAQDVVVKGLKRLEYRGYDSAGVAGIQDELTVTKCKGKVAKLEAMLSNTNDAEIGIGHIAGLHGEPNDTNSHPHTSTNGKIAVVHNGIIENYGIKGAASISRSCFLFGNGYRNYGQINRTIL